MNYPESLYLLHDNKLYYLINECDSDDVEDFCIECFIGCDLTVLHEDNITRCDNCLMQYTVKQVNDPKEKLQVLLSKNYFQFYK